MSPGLILHPRTALGRAADAPSLGRGTVAVIATGIVSLGLELIAAVDGDGGRTAVVVSAAVPVLVAGFWLCSAVLVGAGARLMGWEPRRRVLLAVTGLTYPVLVLYALIVLAQALAPRLGGDTVSAAAGFLALPVAGWFVALNAVAVAAVYRSSPLAAVAIALLPYAALSAAILLLVVVLSLLHAAGLA